MAAPIPDDPPVTKATHPDQRSIVFLNHPEPSLLLSQCITRLTVKWKSVGLRSTCIEFFGTGHAIKKCYEHVAVVAPPMYTCLPIRRKNMFTAVYTGWPPISLNLSLVTRDSIYAIARICYRPSVRLSVSPSLTRVDQSKTVEVRIMQFSPYSSPIPLVFDG